MNILNGSKYNFTYQSYNAIIIDFDIYNDSNYWDSNIQGVERELWFNLSISSTDFYSNDTLHCAYTYYDDFDLNYLRNQFINQSDYRSDLDNINMQIAPSSYMYNGNNFIIASNTMFQNYGNKFNFENSKNLVVYLWYDENDLYLDDSQICYTNKTNTPFANRIKQENYINGYNTGYEQGQNANQEEIYNQGYQVGQEQGYQQGYNTGYTNGENSNKAQYYNQGYNQGYENGIVYGYEQGYNEGLEDTDNNMLSHAMIVATDTPIRIFKQAFDFEILGINIARC